MAREHTNRRAAPPASRETQRDGHLEERLPQSRATTDAAGTQRSFLTYTCADHTTRRLHSWAHSHRRRAPPTLPACWSQQLPASSHHVAQSGEQTQWDPTQWTRTPQQRNGTSAGPSAWVERVGLRLERPNFFFFFFFGLLAFF